MKLGWKTPGPIQIIDRGQDFRGQTGVVAHGMDQALLKPGEVELTAKKRAQFIPKVSH